MGIRVCGDETLRKINKNEERMNIKIMGKEYQAGEVITILVVMQTKNWSYQYNQYNKNPNNHTN